jgi:hypothetical protein
VTNRDAPTPGAPSNPAGKIKTLPWWRDHPRRTADSTIVLAIGTIALAIFSLCQVQATKTALQVTERAYITIGSPTLDTTMKIANFFLSNTGHIPSGKIEIVVHEATMNSLTS